jgi:hypothetical protein
MILFLIILIISVNGCFCLKASDLCKLNSNLTSHCSGLFDKKCNKHYCSINKPTCDDFSSLMTHLDSIENLKAKQKLSSMIQLIQPCTQRHVMVTDFCSNSFTCIKKSTRLSVKSNVEFNRQIYCPCVGKYSFKCEQKYCTINSKACERLKTLKKLPENLKKCGIYIDFILIN